MVVGGCANGLLLLNMVDGTIDVLRSVLQALRDEGCNVLEKTDESECGKFGWVMDPEGNKVEL